MNIIKPGKEIVVNFECPVCECVFDMKQDEYEIEGIAEFEDKVMEGNHFKVIKKRKLKCSAACPNCGYVFKKDQDIK